MRLHVLHSDSLKLFIVSIFQLVVVPIIPVHGKKLDLGRTEHAVEATRLQDGPRNEQQVGSIVTAGSIGTTMSIGTTHMFPAELSFAGVRESMSSGKKCPFFGGSLSTLRT